MSKEKKYRAATLMIRVVDAEGKRRYCPPIYPIKGRLPKKGWAKLDGREEQFPGSTYVLRYRSMSGTRVWESVGTDPDAAVAAQDDRNHILRKEDRGELLPVVKAAPDKELPTAVEAGPERKRLDLTADEWVKSARARHRSRTADVYAATAELFTSVCSKVYLDDVTRDDITEFLEHLKSKEMAPRTRYNHACHMRTFFRWAKVFELITGKDLPEYTEKEVVAYSVEDVAAMRSVANAEERMLLDFLIGTGLREQEAMYCCYEDINFDTCLLHVREKSEFNFRIKDGEERFVLLASSLIARLKERRRRNLGTRLVFPTASGNPNGHMLLVIKRLHFRGRLNCGHCRTKPRNGDAPRSCAEHPVCRQAELHKTRKTYATMLSEAGVAVQTISKLLGHSDLATTMRYLQSGNLRSAKMKSRMDACFASLDVTGEQEVAA